MRFNRSAWLVAGFASLLLVGTACSKDSSSATPGDTSTGTEITATVKDFAIALSPSDAAAGEVKFIITNDGPSTHEFVVISTDLADDALPVTDGLVSEDGVEVTGEAEDIASGASPSLVLSLDAGQYVIICNIVGHYEAGMHTSLTVA